MGNIRLLRSVAALFAIFVLVSPACSTESATATIPALAVSPTSAAETSPAQPSLAPASTRTPAPKVPAASPAAVCSYDWFFSDSPQTCPKQPPIYSQAIMQHFERGLMIWREEPDFYGSQIYVFFTDGKQPHWNPTNDRWRPGMPESDPAIEPPAGYYQPVREFGLFWREAYFGQIGLSARERLGWATEEEVSLDELPLQCHNTDSYEDGCFLVGPDGEVYAFDADNDWFIWGEPPSAP